MAATRETALASGSVDAPEALYDKLSPGPGMPAREVASHQRARIHAAMIEIVGEGGYSSVTVRELANLAGVSTRAFYAHFQDKEECFLRTHELVAQRSAAQIVASQSGASDWRERMRRAFATFAGEIEDKPRAARLALVEPFAVGPAALEAVRRTNGVFEAMVAKSLVQGPGAVEVPPLLVSGIVAGVSRVARARLLSGREREMHGVTAQLLQWALSFRDEAVSQLGDLDWRSVPVGRAAELVAKSAAEDERRTPDDDRALILTAVTKLAVAEGYAQLTVPRIRGGAGVSRRSFDAHFQGVEDCFLAALELRTARAVENAAAQAGDRDWTGGVYRTVASLCMRIACDPALAKLAFVDVFAPGSQGLRCRESIVKTIAELLTAGAPPLHRPSELAAEASAGAVWGILHDYVTAGRVHELPRIAASISFLALAPTVEAPAVMEAIRREQERTKGGQQDDLR
jgi:AcrR family transcriptional regulator